MAGLFDTLFRLSAGVAEAGLLAMDSAMKSFRSAVDQAAGLEPTKPPTEAPIHGIPSLDGYAVDANLSMAATKDKPILLSIVKQDEVKGLVAIPVAKGDRLPRNANGVISLAEIKAGKRVVLEGQTIKVMVPWQIKEAKGFKYKDTFKHKGIRTNPWSGAWNVAMVLCLGLALGLVAEGFTDLLGMKIEKIEHGH